MSATEQFANYAALYDLVYSNKETEAEVGWIADELERWSPGFAPGSILELGSGTGRHAAVLSSLGHTVLGVEQSQQMIDLVPPSAEFETVLGDARTVRLDRTFDAVLSLFHVVSYQTTDDDVRQMFETAAVHLEPGGLFGFDVWFSPAVHSLVPEPRVLDVENDELRVVRRATPREDLTRSLVTVNYDFDVEDKRTGSTQHFSETHLMRHFSHNEIVGFAAAAGFEFLGSVELLTCREPSRNTWGVWFAMRKS
jgi:SAM-dependent methyltransferase